MLRNGWMVGLAVVVGFFGGPEARGEQVAVTAAQQAITVDSGGNVGVGQLTPAADLHVRDMQEPAGNTEIRIEAAENKQPWLRFVNGANEWVFGSGGGGGLFMSKVGTAYTEWSLTSNGHLILNGDLTVYGDIACPNDPELDCGADRVFEPDYPLESIEDHAEAMWRNRHLPTVGATDEDGPFAVGDKVLRMLNELEKAHIYIDQLNKRLGAREQAAAQFEQRHFAGGRWVDASSRELKENVAELEADVAIETAMALSPIRFTYSKDSSEEHLGFIAEDVPELVATANRKTLSAMDVVAVLTRTVQEQQRLLQEKDAQLQAVEQRLARLETLLADGQATASASRELVEDGALLN